MKRFHVHLAVDNLEDTVRFYSTLFGAAPSVQKADYAKWMLDDPRINFAVSTRGSQPGLNHLGFQVDSDEELQGMRERLLAADTGLTEESGAHCCYAVSDKYWVTDPQGIAWETYHTLGSIPVFGTQSQGSAEAEPSNCCMPESTDVSREAARSGCCTPKSAKVSAAHTVTSRERCCP